MIACATPSAPSSALVRVASAIPFFICIFITDMKRYNRGAVGPASDEDRNGG
jgi:hypothetical protein